MISTGREGGIVWQSGKYAFQMVPFVKSPTEIFRLLRRDLLDLDTILGAV